MSIYSGLLVTTRVLWLDLSSRVFSWWLECCGYCVKGIEGGRVGEQKLKLNRSESGLKVIPNSHVSSHTKSRASKCLLGLEKLILDFL